MSRRIEIELTSKREDGTWTWRAAGAREPKGVVESTVVPSGSSVKDVLRAEVETDLDGTRVLSILPSKQKTARTGLLEILPNDKPFEPVTQKLARKERRDDGKRGPRRDRPANKDGEKSDRAQRPRRPHFETPPELPMRPKAKRLRAGRTHVDAVLKDLPEAQRAIAEKVLSGGVPAVRAAVDQQNKTAVAAGQEKIPADGVVQMAEQLLPSLRVAEWLDKAEGAQRIIAEIDLRDLRAIVVASNDPVIARDESTRTLVGAMKAALAKRQDDETKNWLDDIQAATNVGRVVRALKLSSQPPKAGVPFPGALAAQLAAATTAALTIDAPTDRWIALLEAAAFSPIRLQVNPASPSSTVSAELTKTVMRLGPLMPQIAALYGVVVDPKAHAPRPLRPQRQDKPQAKRPDGRPERTNGGPERTNGRPERTNGRPERSEGGAPKSPRRDARPTPAPDKVQPAPAPVQPEALDAEPAPAPPIVENETGPATE